MSSVASTPNGWRPGPAPKRGNARHVQAGHRWRRASVTPRGSHRPRRWPGSPRHRPRPWRLLGSSGRGTARWAGAPAHAARASAPQPTTATRRQGNRLSNTKKDARCRDRAVCRHLTRGHSRPMCALSRVRYSRRLGSPPRVCTRNERDDGDRFDRDEARAQGVPPALQPEANDEGETSCRESSWPR